MEFAVLAILVLLLVVAVVLAILEVELAWTVAVAVFGILVISVGAAVLWGGGPKLATNPVNAVRATLGLAAYVAMGLTILAATAYGIRIWVVWRRREEDERDRKKAGRSPD